MQLRACVGFYSKYLSPQRAEAVSYSCLASSSAAFRPRMGEPAHDHRTVPIVGKTLHLYSPTRSTAHQLSHTLVLLYSVNLTPICIFQFSIPLLSPSLIHSRFIQILQSVFIPKIGLSDGRKDDSVPFSNISASALFPRAVSLLLFY